MSGPFLFLLLCITITIVVLVIFIDWHEAERLNLTIGGCMADPLKIGETTPGKIAPANAAGATAPVFDVVWVDPGDAYDVTVAPDGLTAVFVAKAAGTGNFALVNAITKSGAFLTDTKPLPDVLAAPVDEEAVTLNLSIG